MDELEAAVTGESCMRVDAIAKVTGRARYTDDYVMAGMCYAKYVRSPIAHGYAQTIDSTAARALPGVLAVFTWEDVPDTPFATAGHAWSLDPNKRDLADRLLLHRHVRHHGDAVAIVVARDELTAEKAAHLVHVEWESLPVITSPEAALAEDAIALHEDGNLLKSSEIMANDPLGAISGADHQFSSHFQTAVVQHCHMEGVTSFAWMEEDKRITIVSSTQIPHIVRRITAQALGMSWSSIRVIKPYIGGGFGNKQDVLEEPMAAFLTSRLGGIPVKVSLSREECFMASRTRHAFTIDAQLGMDKDGTLKGYHLDVLSNTGAYASHGHSIAAAGGNKISYLYPRSAFGYHARTCYTNFPSAGAMRGYGAPQVIFPLESLMDDAAAALNLDPVDVRLRNVAQEGDVNPVNHKTIYSAGLPECLRKGRELFEWDKRRAEYASDQGNLRRGVGVACFSYGSNTWPVGVEISGARALLNQDGCIHVQCGATEIGQGADTVFTQMVAETIGMPVNMVHVISTQDTDVTPFDPGAFGSRQSYVAAPALREAAQQLREKIILHAAEMLHQSAMNLTIRHGMVEMTTRPGLTMVSVADVAMDAFYHPDRGNQLSAEASVKTRTNPPTFGCSFVDLTVDIALCKITINRILNVQDSGRILNPQLAAGQMHGGMGMGIGSAIFEEMIIDETSGLIRNPNLLDYKMPTMMDLPDLECAFVESCEPQSAYGHKSLGEPPLIPIAPAIRNAVRMATGVGINTLPLTPKRLFIEFRRAGLIKG
ncbi:xanthine dehydrogenase molybdenum-binding subunit XdhA [Yokenella regensburgei]|jgi:xanthine dehydrogenase molybdenum-binding subunit|uniref:4-hydroxybenzoyl-CoA reductase subunit alpha n=1 Tax=Yokenella regensburgei TaxID=158877 RepID=A0AB38FWY7_9ENTR|nr:xanthine dehydrogenase molybdenum-binding subunit XdhA [Yokenella regensburgei]KAF1370752.1 xanthine dehydrogenase molybdenum-binding subunit [Yokenella regensburgei]KFD25252.1 xanthine dehydrogenase molybdenum-binding subunit [Yokenella regensburgei ATCC 49455]MDQ4429468.1 xanthine dehydrogenase molybdenum-binding subunit XdhA [Yokenella regensburgei]QIU91558.1 xanthine dehydrogenase molybdenum-binding subunit XdhA [Yokenella regensburgei]SQA63286.1 4-hydroxybenzoyl-CoA reductase subunit a